MEAVVELKKNVMRLEGAYPHESAGSAAAADLSDCVDAAIKQIWESIGGQISGAALVAIGGYGRRQMCPRSDIDLLVVSRRGAASESVRALSYALWDTGFELGLLTSTEKEAYKLAAADFDTMCAFLDARLIHGDAGLFHDFHDKVFRGVRSSPEKFVSRLREISQDRWLKAGDAGAELEPDLKRSKGGLRDLAALNWIRKVTGSQATVRPEVLEGCLDLLLTVRQGLHLETGRPSDSLTMQLQIPVAKRLATDEFELMKRLYACCRPAAFAAEAALLGPDLLERAVESFCAAFGEKQADGGREAYHTPDEWPAAAREALLEILSAGEGGRRAFRAIDVRGALPAALPEWSQVRHRAQRNIYHRWSVDVHCFETVCELVHLADSDDDFVRQVATDSKKDWDSLLMAGLLHDIGKGAGEDHSSLGERLADKAATRIGIRASAGRDVSWLVRHHLLLTQVATRRDISEEALIVDVAERVGSQRRLRMLYLLSIADARATGPAAWTAWKANLMSQLFSEVNHLFDRKELVGGDASRKAGERANELRARLAHIHTETVNRHLATMPRAWLLSQSPSALLQQSEIMLSPRSEPITLRARQNGEDGLWEVTVIAPDRPGLLSKVSGVLALHGFDVVTAQIFTTEDGLALEVFGVEAAHGRDERFDKAAADAIRAVTGELSLAEALSRKRRDYAGRVEKGKQEPPQVVIDNRASDFYTVVEVHATDRIGLLYEITSALANLGVDIHLAKVATYAEDVVDSFYVRDLDGQKITDPGKIDELKKSLLEALLSAGPDSI